MFEARFGVIVGIVAGFGSIISEMGAVMLVGGNIAGHTSMLISFVANGVLVALQSRSGSSL